MVNWKIVYTKQAQKDAKKLKASGLKEKALNILEILKKKSLTKHLHLLKN